MHRHWPVACLLVLASPVWGTVLSEPRDDQRAGAAALDNDETSDGWLELDYPLAVAGSGVTAAAAAALGSSAGMIVGFGSGVFLTDSYTAWAVIAAFAAIGSGVVSAVAVALGVALFAGPERGLIAGVVVGAAVSFMWLAAVAALLNTPTLLGTQLEGAVWVPVVFGGPALLAAVIGGLAGVAAVPHHRWWSNVGGGE